ncbi:MAG: TetR/AcrR family transcriptional regulator [Kofleriaceae bacterium]|nr:TetR/AcrR family transcriptional regulator [Kofleriaceae bacterium]
MARPIDTKKRQEICDKSVNFFREHGIECSMSRLAEGLSIKRPTLLYHFSDRAAIFEFAFTNLLAKQAQFVIGKMMEHEHPIDQLYHQVKAVHEFHHGHEERILFLTQAIALSGSDRTKKFIEIGNQAFEIHRQALTKRIVAGIEAGTVHPCDPAALIHLCRAMIDGLMLQRVMLDVELAPVHSLLWEVLLAPLKRDPLLDNH